ncbi:MAG: dephospho-CoA kinase [Candidatus Omnitrophota bacterium]
MLKIGLTGSMGSGKSTIAAMFAARGADVIVADNIVHLLYEKNKSCQSAIRRAFGNGIAGLPGIDRAALAKIVFNDPDALRLLESIVHPYLRREIEAAIKAAKRQMVVVDAAVLCEAGWHTLVDAVIVVKARREIQIKRAMGRNGLSREDVLKRIRRQMPLSEKMKYAAYIIDNSGSAAATKQQVERIIRFLTEPRSSGAPFSQHPSNRSNTV